VSKNGVLRKIFVSEGMEASKEHAMLLCVCVCLRARVCGVCVCVCVREEYLKFKFYKICNNVCGLLLYRCTCRAPLVHLIPPPNAS
jgi:hypothetical protein